MSQRAFSMETICNSQIQLPPGFRFHPSDEELIIHYLRNKVASTPLPGSFIAEIDLYKYNPWDLPKKALFGEDEWFFFTPRERKYPNGLRPNRAAGSGYWKATGTDKPILTASGMKSIGVKKALVFYQGRPPKGSKTDWIMHEYRLLDSIIRNSKKKGSMRLDDWVLCRVRQRNSNSSNNLEERKETGDKPFSFLEQTADPTSTITNDNMELVKNYIYNEFPMLPYIFASLNLPVNVDLASSTQCSDDKRPCASFYEDNTDIMERQTSPAAPAMESLRNPLKRKHMEGNQLDLNILQQSENCKEEVRTPASSHAVATACGETNQYNDYNFNDFDQWSFNTQLDDLNNLEL